MTSQDSGPKSAPKLNCFVIVCLDLCFAPQRRALFRQPDFQKCSDVEMFLAFSPSKCASRHNGVWTAGRCSCMSEYVRGRYQLVPWIFVLLSTRTCDGFYFYFVETNARLAHLGVHPSDRTPVLTSLRESTALLFQKKLAEFPATLRVEPHHKVLMPQPRALLVMVTTRPATSCFSSCIRSRGGYLVQNAIEGVFLPCSPDNSPVTFFLGV